MRATHFIANIFTGIGTDDDRGMTARYVDLRARNGIKIAII